MFLRNLFCSSEHEEMECDEILERDEMLELSEKLEQLEHKANDILSNEFWATSIVNRSFKELCKKKTLIDEIVKKREAIIDENAKFVTLLREAMMPLRVSLAAGYNRRGIKITLYAKKIENDTPSQGPTKYIFYSEKSLEEAKLSFGKICQLINGNETVVKGFTEQNIEQIKKLHPTWFVLGLNKEQDKWSVVLGIDTI